MKCIFIFQAANAKFSSSAFTSRELAEAWISKHCLTGTLTKYPINEGVYDWAIQNKYFTPKKEQHSTPEFIGGFTSASQEHYHYEAGVCYGGIVR